LFDLSILLFLLFASVLLSTSCEQDHASCELSGDSLVVALCGLGESLSLVDMEGAVCRDREGTGRLPNDLLRWGDTLCVLNSGSNSLEFYGAPPELHWLGALALSPRGLDLNPYALDADGTHFWISCFLTDSLLQVDPHLGVLAAYAVGHHPEGVLCWSGRVFTANTNFQDQGYGPGSVSVLNTSDGSIRLIPVSTNPQRLLVLPDGRPAVVCTGAYQGEGRLEILDTLSWEVETSIDLDCDPLDLRFKGEVGWIAAGGWELPPDGKTGLVLVFRLSAGAIQWLHGPRNPLPVSRGAFSLTPVETGMLVACFGSGRVDYLDESGEPLFSVPVGDGVQELLLWP
jgi:hypothetical protein